MIFKQKSPQDILEYPKKIHGGFAITAKLPRYLT